MKFDQHTQERLRKMCEAQRIAWGVQRAGEAAEGMYAWISMASTTAPQFAEQYERRLDEHVRRTARYAQYALDVFDQGGTHVLV